MLRAHREPSSTQAGALAILETGDAAVDCDGAYNGERIMLRKDMRENPGRLLDTVLHEIIHAIGRCLDLRLSERQVRLLAHALATLIVDNPRLVRWLACRD